MEAVRVPLEDAWPEDASLLADVAVDDPANGVVLFAHGSGSGRHSPRNRQVAEELHRAGLGTVLTDLLTEDEDRSADHRFDIDLLSGRVVALVDWASRRWPSRIGVFGASTGAAAALVAAALRPRAISAVVSRGGRPDLAGKSLERVRQPTLLIVGERDEVVIELNHDAMARLNGPTRLEIVAGATHLFEEPGALGQVAQLATAWFLEHLNRSARP